MPRRLSPQAIAALLLVFAGCSYEAEAEYSRERVVPANSACPSASSVASSEGADDAELVGERLVPRGMLCWYRVEDEGGTPYCSGILETDRTLDVVRAGTRTETLAPMPGVRCTADNGPVLMVLAGANGCEPTLDGDTVSDFEPGAPVRGARMFPKERIAVDDRTPTKVCEYEVEDEYTRRPFSCGAGGQGALR